MSLVRNAYAVSLLLTALAVLVLGAAAWLRRRATRGGAALAWLAAAAAAWAICEAAWLSADGGTAAATWLQVLRAAEAVAALALLAYALRTTRFLARAAEPLLWTASVLTAAVVALALGPIGGLSLWRALSPGATLGQRVMQGVLGPWGTAASVLSAVMVAGALMLLVVAWLRAGETLAARDGWTLLGVAMPVGAQIVAALVPASSLAGHAAVRASGLSPGAFLLAPAALAIAQGLLGGGRGLTQEGELDSPRAVGAAPRELLDHLDQPVLLVSPGEVVSYANAAAARLFMAVERLRGAQAAALFAHAPEMEAALTGRRRAVLELELARGGEARVFEAWLTPLFEASGRFAGTMVALADTAARRRAEAEGETAATELRRHETLLEALQEALRGALRGEPLGLLLDIVVTGAARVLGVPHGALYLTDAAGETLERRVALGWFESAPAPPLRRQEGLVGRVWATGKVETAEAMAPSGDEPADEDDEGWAGTVIGVPVRDRGQTVGVLSVARKRNDWRAYGDDEIAILDRFADLAVMAVRDAGAHHRAQHAEAELRWLDRLDALVVEDAGYADLLDTALRAAREVAGFDRTVVWLATAERNELEARAWLGFPQGPEGGERWPLNGTVPLLEEAYRSGREIVLTGGGPLPARLKPSGSAESAPLLRVSRPAVLPLLAGGGVLGVLLADDRREGVELEARLEALRRVAARVAQALDRDRLRAAGACLQGRMEDAERRMQAESMQREALIEALPAAYFETDLRGVVTRSSRALGHLSETRQEALKGVRLADLSAAGAEPTVPQLMGRALRSGRPIRSALWALRRHAGGELEVEITLAVLRDAEGAPAGYFGVVVPRRR